MKIKLATCVLLTLPCAVLAQETKSEATAEGISEKLDLLLAKIVALENRIQQVENRINPQRIGTIGFHAGGIHQTTERFDRWMREHSIDAAYKYDQYQEKTAARAYSPGFP